MFKDRIAIFFQSFFTLRRIQYIIILVLGIGLISFLIISSRQTDNRSKASTNSSQETEAGLLSGNTQIGIDTTASGGQYVVFGQMAAAIPTNTPVPPPTNTPAPVTVNGKLGTMMATWDVNTQRTQINKQFNFAWMTPGNEMKMQFLDTCKKDAQGNEILDFTKGDQILAYAQGLGMQTHGHTMVWHSQTSACASSYTQQDLLNYVKQVATHYCGKVYSFDVVNEALSDDGGYRNQSPWYGKFGGPGYIEASFRAARTACPSMKLYINDYAADWQNAKSDMLLSVAKDLHAKGILDGVGLQMHVDSGINTSIVATNMKRFTDAGLELAISEMDVQVYTPTPNTDQLNKQASVFGGVAAACYSNPSCKRFTVAGVDDGMSWINTFFQPDAALLFDRNYQPKPAWFSVKSALHL